VAVFFTKPALYNSTAENAATITLTVIAALVSLSGMVVRAYTIGTTPHGTSGRNTDKQLAKQLNTKGIYSMVRHPLYLGNYLMWAGLLIYTMNLSLFIIVSLVYWLYYERIMFAEERYLEREFGETYREWSLRVPAFLPAFRKFEKGDIPFSMRSVLRREYSGFFALVLGFVAIDYIRAYVLWKEFCTGCCLNSFPIRPSFIVLIISFVITITLRTLKHHSKILSSEENRD
ncbi:MAG: DUF1295 domain-containing protein, partial [Bacteroidales bacterium]|nr:DUF1295 domain-containing protein [Bacteroidales bacterium]